MSFNPKVDFDVKDLWERLGTFYAKMHPDGKKMIETYWTSLFSGLEGLYYDLYKANLNTYLEYSQGYTEHIYQAYDIVFEGLNANAVKYPTSELARSAKDLRDFSDASQRDPHFYYTLPEEGYYLSIPILSGLNTGQVLYEGVDYEIYNYTKIKFLSSLSEYEMLDFTDSRQAVEILSGISLMPSELPKRKREIFLVPEAVTLLPTLSNFLLPAFGQDAPERLLDSGYYSPFVSGYKSDNLTYIEKQKAYSTHLAKTCQAWICYFKSKPTLKNLEKLYALIKGFPFSYKDGVVKEINIGQDGYDYIVIQTLKNTVEYIAVGAKWRETSPSSVISKVVGSYLQVKSAGRPNHTELAGTTTQPHDFWIPINSLDTDVPTSLNVGSVGVHLNGVPFKLQSPTGYNGSTAWRKNLAKELTPDQFGGVVDSSTGEYYYITNPKGSYDATPGKHSPIVGYAFDGYPIYGPYGYVSNDGEDGLIQRLTSSYEQKSGPRDPNNDPAIPDGTYNGTWDNDYKYVQGLGILDENNGRYSSTPEYPGGIYHYHITLDASGHNAYPYVLKNFKAVPNLVRGLIKNIGVSNLSDEVLTYELPTGGNYLCEVGSPINKFDILMSGISMHDYITSPETLSGIITREGTTQQFEVSVIKDFDGNSGFNIGTLSEAVIFTGSVLQPQSTQADTSASTIDNTTDQESQSNY